MHADFGDQSTGIYLRDVYFYFKDVLENQPFDLKYIHPASVISQSDDPAIAIILSNRKYPVLELDLEVALHTDFYKTNNNNLLQLNGLRKKNNSISSKFCNNAGGSDIVQNLTRREQSTGNSGCVRCTCSERKASPSGRTPQQRKLPSGAATPQGGNAHQDREQGRTTGFLLRVRK
ncbi:hypothetical protein [Mastigocoleus testarum]|nr:hypothetical protein [Mastigocoleus testarum]